MELAIKVNTPESWMQNFARAFNTSIHQGKMQLDGPLGQGIIQSHLVEDGLRMITQEFSLWEELIVHKKKVEEKAYYPIILQYSDSGIFHEVDGKQIPLGRGSFNSIIIPSPLLETSIHYPAGNTIQTLAIVMSRDWLEKHVKHIRELSSWEASIISDIFLSQRPFFIYEAITLNIARVIEEVVQCSYATSVKSLYMRAKVYELLALIFNLLYQRGAEQPLNNLNKDDVHTAFKVRQILLAQMDAPPTIPKLSREVAMSESKLKKVFKLVFGLSIYQYTLSNRMQKAKNLLDTRRYNVTEVGQLLGYSNMAHFAKAFKKQYNLSPSSYLATIRH